MHILFAALIALATAIVGYAIGAHDGAIAERERAAGDAILDAVTTEDESEGT